MPDVNFYENLKYQFEAIRESQIALDKCMANTTGLMEQAAHLQSSLEDITPLVAEQGSAMPDPIPLPPSNFDFSAPVVPPNEPVDLRPVVGVQYDTAAPTAQIGVISYE